MQRPRQGQVIIGVDTHKEIHVAAAVDWQGGGAGRQGILPDDQAGLPPARVVGDVLRVGAECSGSYGSGLTRHLAKNKLPCWR